MSREQKITGNIKPPNKDLEILKQNFSNCFDKSGNLDFEKLKKQISANEINFSKESYGMDWLGKSYARLLATDESTTLLKEDETFNQKEENKNSENLLIKGDNLEVLKHLSNAYFEKIKMIYIDPPYNTGNDGFVYADDRKFTVVELQELAGISEERAKRILDFTQSKSNSHSAWLTFMYPRLYIAKQLLKEEGVIFISIDENEHSQLKLLCDEIFGEQNFITSFIWKNKKGGGNDSKYVAVEHESIIMYTKNENYLEKLFEKYTSEYLKRYCEKDNVSKFYWDTFKRKSGKQYYPITCPDGKILEFDENGNKISWLRSKSRFEDDLLKGEIKILKNPQGDWTVHFKQRLPKGKKPRTILIEESLLDNEGTTSNGSAEILTLFGKNVFDNPKPVKLLLKLLNILTEEDDFILDFFAGSGTTGDAVMQLNAEDSGNLKFILAQLPELIDPKNNKTAYEFVKNELKVETPNIFEITKERLIRASKKIQEKNKDKDFSNQDLGFKIFETIPIWEDYNFDSEELEKQTSLFDESKLTKEDIKALLVTWKTYDGISLTETEQKTDLNGYTAHYCNEKLYLMDKDFKTENLKILLEKIDIEKGFNPTTIIAFGYHFESKNLREVSENIKSYANKKNIDIDFVTRY